MTRRLLVPAGEPLQAAGRAPTFSIVIPAYQASSFVGRAVESALAQTLPAVEVIVSDDGSTDDLAGALSPYSDRVQLLRGAHGGPPVARNRGFAAATGEFVVNLDADDVFYPERLAALGELAATYPELDVLTSDVDVVHEGRRIRRLYSPPWSFQADDQPVWILRRNFLVSCAAVRRRRFLEIGGFDESILWADDWDLWIRLLHGGSRAGCVDEPLAEYAVREGSITTRQVDVIRDEIKVLEKAAMLQLEQFERDGLVRLIEQRRRDLARYEVRRALVRGDAHARRRAIALAVAPGYMIRTRLKMAASVVAPGLTRRLLEEREEREWLGAGGTIVERE